MAAYQKWDRVERIGDIKLLTVRLMPSVKYDGCLVGFGSAPWGIGEKPGRDTGKVPSPKSKVQSHLSSDK